MFGAGNQVTMDDYWDNQARLAKQYLASNIRGRCEIERFKLSEHISKLRRWKYRSLPKVGNHVFYPSMGANSRFHGTKAAYEELLSSIDHVDKVEVDVIYTQSMQILVTVYYSVPDVSDNYILHLEIQADVKEVWNNVKLITLPQAIFRFLYEEKPYENIMKIQT